MFTMKKIPKIAFLSSLALCASLAVAQDITPTRVGPVSQYGQLMTGKNSQGQGRIYGSCEGVKDGAEVQVRGMSLFWSMITESTEFWTPEGIATMVRDMNIQIVRAAMGTTSEDWWGCKNGSNDGSNCEHITGYATDAEFQTNRMNTVVQAAIENDIYVIIDWHSHQAHEEVANATKFFTEMAQKWGKYDHVIFELYNEPLQGTSWSTVKSYAETIVPIIRQYSDNLILVGSRDWDQHPDDAIGNTVSGDNIAYTFHYYANSHCWSGQKDANNQCEGENAQKAINAGLSVFVSEWGTANADGGGDPDQSKNTGWQNWMNTNQLSWANWSASKKNEGTAAFSSGANRNSLQYTTSGNMVKGYLATNPTSYTKCAANGGNENGNNGGNENGGNDETPILAKLDMNYSVTFADKAFHIAGSPAKVEIYTLNGNKLMSVDNVSGTLSLASLPAGKYFAKIYAHSGSTIRAFQIK